MTTDTYVRILASMMAGAVAFGIGAIAILSIPALSDHAEILLPVAVLASFIVGGIAGWYYGPLMRARYWRNQEAKNAANNQRLLMR